MNAFIHLVGKDFIVKFLSGFSSISLIKWYYINPKVIKIDLVKIKD